MIVAGVTGGIGSGKTTVCKVWERLGAKVFYADDEAKRLMVKDNEVRQSIINTFGEESYNKNGSLNKSYLIHEAFHKNRVEELNRIVHPAVSKEFIEVCESARKAGKKMVVKEAAILLNKGRPKNLDIVVLVKSPEKNRVERVVKRDNINEEDVLKRVSKQPDFNELESIADIIINNTGTLTELEQKAKKVFEKLV